MSSVIIFLSKLRYLIYLTIILLAWLWFVVEDESCKVVSGYASVASPAVKRAIWKMGPYYDYKMVGDKLYVNKGDGKWRRLRYDK